MVGPLLKPCFPDGRAHGWGWLCWGEGLTELGHQAFGLQLLNSFAPAQPTPLACPAWSSVSRLLQIGEEEEGAI